ncbi:ABC transporter ATP-binding protein [Fusobacterium polymorphum]|uniref:ABC transporter ATP-binding protein n=1 Tax=Fusobacterium nucleatum subsp. polymorphum TaxID=76857 RepID=UPI003008AF45
MLLEVKNLSVKIKKSGKKIVKNISFNMEENTCLGILGESGSGKSMTCKSMLGILKENLEANGEIIFDGRNLLTLKKEESRDIRGKEICMILQNPMTSFDPLYTIGNQLLETFLEHLNINRDEAYKLAVESLEKMRLKDIEEVLKKYPHELSGGMLQRIMIAIAIALKPKLIIADEPTTAIDSLNQKDIIDEFIILKKELNVSLLFVTHDLGVLTNLADNLIVMQNGEIVEKGTTKEIMINAKHKHTKFLIGTRRALMEKFEKVKEYDK